MFASITTMLAASAAVVSAATLGLKRSQVVGMTPHDQFSSSIGALGCKLNTNRVAYWPSDVSCNNICVKVSHQGRSVHLLKIDKSGGAYDISYDAWNYLTVGKSAKEAPSQGGAIDMQYEFVNADECKHLLHGGKLAIIAAAVTSGTVLECITQGNNWLAKNYVALNINDSVCKGGHDEKCTLDLNKSNQAQCPHTLGSSTPLNLRVTNILYGSGKEVAAA